MQNTQSSFEVLDLRHHFTKALHFGKHIYKRLVVVQSFQNFVSQCFLDVVYSLFLCCSCLYSRVFLGFQGCYLVLQRVDELLVLYLHLSLRLNACSSQSLSPSLRLGS